MVQEFDPFRLKPHIPENQRGPSHPVENLINFFMTERDSFEDTLSPLMAIWGNNPICFLHPQDLAKYDQNFIGFDRYNGTLEGLSGNVGNKLKKKHLLGKDMKPVSIVVESTGLYEQIFTGDVAQLIPITAESFYDRADELVRTGNFLGNVRGVVDNYDILKLEIPPDIDAKNSMQVAIDKATATLTIDALESALILNGAPSKVLNKFQMKKGDLVLANPRKEERELLQNLNSKTAITVAVVRMVANYLPGLRYNLAQKQWVLIGRPEKKYTGQSPSQIITAILEGEINVEAGAKCWQRGEKASQSLYTYKRSTPITLYDLEKINYESEGVACKNCRYRDICKEHLENKQRVVRPKQSIAVIRAYLKTAHELLWPGIEDNEGKYTIIFLPEDLKLVRASIEQTQRKREVIDVATDPVVENKNPIGGEFEDIEEDDEYGEDEQMNETYPVKPRIIGGGSDEEFPPTEEKVKPTVSNEIVVDTDSDNNGLYDQADEWGDDEYEVEDPGREHREVNEIVAPKVDTIHDKEKEKRKPGEREEVVTWDPENPPSLQQRYTPTRQITDRTTGARRANIETFEISEGEMPEFLKNFRDKRSQVIDEPVTPPQKRPGKPANAKRSNPVRGIFTAVSNLGKNLAHGVVKVFQDPEPLIGVANDGITDRTHKIIKIKSNKPTPPRGGGIESVFDGLDGVQDRIGNIGARSTNKFIGKNGKIDISRLPADHELNARIQQLSERGEIIDAVYQLPDGSYEIAMVIQSSARKGTVKIVGEQDEWVEEY